uniref:L-ornithine N(5)-oxygenase n=1 Tax=Chromera velia CCMP2878 TaxID=1169474 RepID=A0A0G4HXB3_9ALVE|eukprot:Cvel_9239.t1-p1 / transcript=Cvel_9239.t1 / gene=Cvel_9239 / organism=Chromera_velia_CCMP2878 / gene_product=hypothetical protein / transcript_product=hypothetical protein / location=Cvel_scaffold527:57828-66990(+) / protein_length=1060 / sequence_SO=supercontig / SO=protein_coding / is_pseudo=false
MSNWNHLFNLLRIPYLRSPAFLHPDPEHPDSLQAFAFDKENLRDLPGRGQSGRFGRKNDSSKPPDFIPIDAITFCSRKKKDLKTKGHKNFTQTGAKGAPVTRSDRDATYQLPSSAIFQNFCAHVVSKYKLDSSILQGKAKAVRRVKVSPPSCCPSFPKVYEVELESGEKRYARCVVLGIGPTNQPNIPPWASSVRPNGDAHPPSLPSPAHEILHIFEGHETICHQSMQTKTTACASDQTARSAGCAEPFNTRPAATQPDPSPPIHLHPPQAHCDCREPQTEADADTEQENEENVKGRPNCPPIHTHTSTLIPAETAPTDTTPSPPPSPSPKTIAAPRHGIPGRVSSSSSTSQEASLAPPLSLPLNTESPHPHCTPSHVCSGARKARRGEACGDADGIDAAAEVGGRNERKAEGEDVLSSRGNVQQKQKQKKQPTTDVHGQSLNENIPSASLPQGGLPAEKNCSAVSPPENVQVCRLPNETDSVPVSKEIEGGDGRRKVKGRAGAGGRRRKEKGGGCKASACNDAGGKCCETVCEEGLGYAAGKRVVVVGGGISSAHLTLAALAGGASHVFFLCRGILKERQFDLSTEWFGKYRGLKQYEFKELPESDKRAFIAKERGGGSIPKELLAQLRVVQREGKVTVMEMSTVESARWCEGGGMWELGVTTKKCALSPSCEEAGQPEGEFVNVKVVRAEFVRLCTGASLSVRGDPLLSQIANEFKQGKGKKGGLGQVCGLPLVSPDLRWSREVLPSPSPPSSVTAQVCPVNTQKEETADGMEDVGEEQGGTVQEEKEEEEDIFVLGAYAALQLGPDALNLAGARGGSRIVATSIKEQVFGQEETEKTPSRAVSPIRARAKGCPLSKWGAAFASGQVGGGSGGAVSVTVDVGDALGLSVSSPHVLDSPVAASGSMQRQRGEEEEERPEGAVGSAQTGEADWGEYYFGNTFAALEGQEEEGEGGGKGEEEEETDVAEGHTSGAEAEAYIEAEAEEEEEKETEAEEEEEKEEEEEEEEQEEKEQEEKEEKEEEEEGDEEEGEEEEEEEEEEDDDDDTATGGGGRLEGEPA